MKPPFQSLTSIIPLSNLIKNPPNETNFIHHITKLAKWGLLKDATNLFNKMPELNCTPSIVTLNSLLSVLCEKKEGLYLVKDVLLKSQKMKIRIDGFTFQVLVKALCKNGKVSFAREIMDLMSLFECDPDLEMYSLVLQSLCKGSYNCAEIMGFVQEMRNAGFLPSLSDCNEVINFVVNEGKIDEAYDFIDEMRNEGIKFDVKSYNLMLMGCLETESFEMADQVFDEMLITGLIPNIYTFNIYVSSLCKKGDLEGAVKMVTCMERIGCNADVAIYNIIISEFIKKRELDKSKDLMNEMVKKKIKWNSDTLTMYFEGLKKEGQILNAYNMFVEMSVSEKECDLGNLGFSNLICGLCEKGFICEAIKVLNYMTERFKAPDSKSWESLVSGMKLGCQDFEILI